jgi:phosphatidylglycerophosphatase A
MGNEILLRNGVGKTPGTKYWKTIYLPMENPAKTTVVSELTSWQKFCVLVIGTAFGLGLAPIAPGSFAALLGIGIHVVYYYFLPASFYIPFLFLTLLLILYLNHLLTPWAETYWQKPDSGNFVLDEIAGYLMIPLLFHAEPIYVAAPIGYLLFRIFDIIKIPPANYVDKNIKTSWGVVLDDLISGAYAVLLMYLFSYMGLFRYMFFPDTG